MKRLNVFLFLTLVLVLLTVFASCTAYECDACKDGDPNCAVCGTQEETQTETQEKPIEYFCLTADAVVVISENNASSIMTDAAMLMCDAGSSLLGSPLFPMTDWYRGELVRNEIELLVGHTNRPESEKAMETLAYYDYMYEVVSPGCVVICGGGDESTKLAVEKFLLDCYGYAAGVSDGALKDLPVGTSYIYRHEYRAATVSLCGEPIGSYTIVHSGENASAAEMLRKEIGRISGEALPVLTVDAFGGGNAIYVGCGRDGEHIYSKFGSDHYVLRYEHGTYQTVIIDGASNIKSGDAIRSFVREVLSYVPEGGTYNIALPEGDRVYCSKLSDEFNGLQLESVKHESIADGVRYVKITYLDAKGAPVIAYAAIADLSKVTAINATPNYEDKTVNAKATTLQAMKSAAAAGYTVIAGVNADFFAIKGDYHPSGLCVKQGKVLMTSSSRPWFGITTDGLPVIATGEQYANRYDGKILEAVGGSNIILKNGFIHDVALGGDFGVTRHPRTAVGITGNNELIILVVDGRQPKISNGASLTDLAYIMMMLGARDALNLDGGGSSTFITHTATDGYVVRNSPSDGSLRKVYNSLVFVKKES